MNRIFVKRIGLAALLVTAAGLAAATPSEARPSRPRSRGFQLFAGPTLGFEVNRVYCGLRAIGETCVDITGSPVLGGGSWPRGSGDAYIFNSGLQIAGIVDAGAGFDWAGDTVGSWFMDPRGDQQSGEQITDIFSSLNAADLAAWPAAATVRDTAIYNDALIGRQTISQQDIWWRYWDGNPGQTTGRGHPAGILVEQRGLGWNFPSGNEDLIYFIYRFINVTASDPAVYAGLADAGYTAADIAEIAALGARFQQQSESRFAINIPAGGYTITNAFAAFFMDPDVGDFNINYSTASLPFALSMAYVGDFSEPAWQFPSNIFSPPFAAAPGFVGVKYLKSPPNTTTPDPTDEFGISIFSNTTNGAPFPDAVGIQQVYRYLSGSVSPATGDNSCTVANPQADRLCALVQTARDTRFFMSSGPFDILPGQSSLIVVAYLFGAPVAAAVAPHAGEGLDLPPGIPPQPDDLASGAVPEREIDRIAGWVSHNDADNNGTIEQTEVTVVERSLLSKSLVAQAVFDNGFLLPFAPEAPAFHTIPGNNQVTIVWQKSPTETIGDPYFSVASDPFTRDALGNPTGPNPLYDANYRFKDVEGYRIWRGRTPSQMEVIAQFDYDTTTFTDSTLVLFNVDYGTQCAPELGLSTSCPPVGHEVPIATQVGIQPGLVQIPPGGRVVTTGGNVVITQADTAVSGGLQCGGAACPNLQDTGVPFAFVDNTARNGFTYHYAVTAFDVNSVKSVGVGNTSLESPLVTRRATPRAGASTEEIASLVSGLFGDDDVPLDPNAPFRIDAATGRFRDPTPPTNGIDAAFAPLVPQLLPALSLTATIDSLVPHSGADGNCGAAENALGACYEAFVTFNRDGVETPVSVMYHHSVWSAFGGGDQRFDGPISLGNLSIGADSAAAARFGIPNGFATFNATVTARFEEYIRTSTMEGQLARRAAASGSPWNLGGGPGISPGGSRWFEGANETVDHPGYGIRVGHLTGVDTVWSPVHHTDIDVATPGAQTYATSGAMQCFGYILGGLARQADIEVTWGAGGTITSVRDVTHRVPVIFKANPQASYGFIGDANADGVISFVDFTFLETVAQNGAYAGLACGMTDPGPGLRASLVQQPVIMPVSTSPVNPGPPTTGTGFGLYINGERFIFQLPAGAPPATGTVWKLRTYSGRIAASAGAGTATPSGYTYVPAVRPPIIPGLRIVFNVPAATAARALAAGDLDAVHTVPDPYYVTSALEISSTTKILRFVNLPPQAIIRIYSTSGVLVNIVNHNDATLGSEATWNLRNRNNQFVASGVYFYHVETPTGQEKVGRFTVVNFAQ